MKEYSFMAKHTAPTTVTILTAKKKVKSHEEYLDLKNVQGAEALTATVFNWAIIFRQDPQRYS